MFVHLHIYPFATEGDALDLQTQALLLGGFMPESNLAACSYHTVPWQQIRRIGSQEPRHGAVI